MSTTVNALNARTTKGGSPIDNIRQRSHGVPPAELARIAAGYGGREGLRRFARAMNCSPRYARDLEIHGGASYVFAHRGSLILDCDPAAWDLRDPKRALPKTSPKRPPRRTTERK